MARDAPVLVAPDDFKGTLSAAEVAGALARGVRGAGLEAEELPVADGGGGTLDVLLGALGGERRSARVSDPLGRPVDAEYGLLPGGRVAVVAMAQASGLMRVAEHERDAWAASTRGTGELVAAAVAAGAEEVILGVGGSATTDGGQGAVEALNEAGVSPELVVLCDSNVAWEDCARVFGPQKGADEEMVRRLEERLDELARAAPRDPRGLPLTGGAGGIAGGLWAHHGARLALGSAYILDAIGFDALMRSAWFVVAGEGTLDEQTPTGKAVCEVARRCREAGVDCHGVVGHNELEAAEARDLGLASVREAGSLEELEAAARALGEEALAVA